MEANPNGNCLCTSHKMAILRVEFTVCAHKVSNIVCHPARKCCFLRSVLSDCFENYTGKSLCLPTEGNDLVVPPQCRYAAMEIGVILDLTSHGQNYVSDVDSHQVQHWRRLQKSKREKRFGDAHHAWDVLLTSALPLWI